MYEKFKYERVALSLIRLDDRNPRIVSQEKLGSEDAILNYLFEHEDLASFLKVIAIEGRNPGAERPYVVKEGKGYVVIEGNTRVATYKLLTGQLIAPAQFAASVPLVPQSVRDELVSVDVTIAPNRDALMTIMARAHFGRGDKTRWGYLGSRKAVYDDWDGGKSISQLSSVFGRPQGIIRDLLLEYMLYLESLKLDWTLGEKDVLLKPSIEFNPPVRFLQSTGHKQMIGIELDKVNLEIKFTATDGKAKLKHLVKRTVIDDNGPSAIASYGEVFAGYSAPGSQAGGQAGAGTDKSSSGAGGAGAAGTGASGDQGNASGGTNASNTDTNEAGSGLKTNALFAYPVKRHDLTLAQLMKEAKGLNTKNYPAAGSALLRSIIEVLLKLIIEEKALNQQGKLLDLEGALNVVIGNGKLSQDDVKVLQEFKKTHLSYMNLSTHATVVPNFNKLMMARDTIDAFIKRNI
ncbi:hypothetical protein [Mesorhizobium loti]|uniref:hypothetical protein n=1 Tax=Rhizobium loti TaxID=381 RepID=UPI0003F6D0E8|nr:hypothetical protein [Mesorhizobium loti]